MSIEYRNRIYCDWVGCQETLELNGYRTTSSSVRSDAVKSGWTSSEAFGQSIDICPLHGRRLADFKIHLNKTVSATFVVDTTSLTEW